MEVLGHKLKLQKSSYDCYDCLICNIEYVHFTNVDGENVWRYIPSTLIGPIYLELTCEEMQIKNLLE